MSTVEFLGKCSDQERREFWKIYRELERNPMLLKVTQLAATLNAEDLKECIEYAAWLKQDERRR